MIWWRLTARTDGGDNIRIKWNGKAIDVQSNVHSKTSFETVWNDYTIVVKLDEWLRRNFKKTCYDAWCYTPSGDAIVNGASYPSIRAAVQDCFDNIGYPLMMSENEFDSLISWYEDMELIENNDKGA